MYLTNRAALVVKAKQPFIDWINYVGEDDLVFSLEMVNRESRVYLIPEHDTPKELEVIIQDIYKEIFEDELLSFHRDRSAWPEVKYQRFLDWFDLKVHSMVIDMCEDEIESEEY